MDHLGKLETEIDLLMEDNRKLKRENESVKTDLDDMIEAQTQQQDSLKEEKLKNEKYSQVVSRFKEEILQLNAEKDALRLQIEELLNGRSHSE